MVKCKGVIATTNPDQKGFVFTKESLLQLCDSDVIGDPVGISFIHKVDGSSIGEVSMGKHETVEVTFTLPNGFFNDEKGYDDIYLVPSFIVKEDGKIQMTNLSLTHYPADPALTPLQKAE